MAHSSEINLFFPGFDRNTIPVFNDTSKLIPAYTAAAISGMNQTGGNWQLCVTPALSDEGIWGVSAENIHPGTWGNMAISGVARAWIASSSGNYVVPSPAGLVGAVSGKAQIICSGSETVPGVIVLGYSGNTDVYNGQFAIRNTGLRTFEVCWPGFDTAGSSDLPGVEQIPVQTVTLPENNTLDSIVFYACCNEGVYSAVIQLRSLDKPQGYFDYVELGGIYANGNVRQIYKDNTGTQLEFGRRWFL